MKNKRLLPILFFVLVIAQKSFSQQEQTLYFADYISQSNLVNPAFVTKGKQIQISLPSFYFNANAPLAISDFVVTRNGKRVLAPFDVNWTGKLQAKNYYDGNLQLHSAAFAFPIGKNFQVSGHHLLSSSQYVNITGDAVTMVYHGNAPFIGRTADFANTVLMDLRSEFGLGLTFHNELFSIGARLKSQNGIAGLFTQGEKLKLTTDKEYYQLRLDTDYELYAFAPTNEGSLIRSALVNNGGFSMDWGFRVNLGRLKISGSVLDMMGSLKWKRGGETYATKGNFEFKGFQRVNPETMTYKKLSDTLRTALNIRNSSGANFLQPMPLRIYASASYDVTPSVKMGGLFYTEQLPNETKVGAMINVSYRLKNWLNVGATYGLRNESATNLGLHTSVLLFKTCEAYFVTDNIISFLQPFDTKAMNARFGMNVRFGKSNIPDDPKEGGKKKSSKKPSKAKGNKIKINSKGMSKRYGSLND
jgi:hypothetical protein